MLVSLQQRLEALPSYGHSSVISFVPALFPGSFAESMLNAQYEQAKIEVERISACDC